jgi:hypothetical protein
LYLLKQFHSAVVRLAISPNHAGWQQKTLRFPVISDRRLTERYCGISQPLQSSGLSKVVVDMIEGAALH